METTPIPSTEVIQALRKIRRNRRLLWVGFLGGFLFMVAMVKVSQGEYLGLVLLFYFIGLFISQFFVYQAKCPSCGKGFYRLWIFYNPYTSKCLNCGLSLKILKRGA
jgi:hypothetical protein